MDVGRTFVGLGVHGLGAPLAQESVTMALNPLTAVSVPAKVAVWPGKIVCAGFGMLKK